MRKVQFFLLATLVLTLVAGCQATRTPTSNVPTATTVPATIHPTTVPGTATCRAVTSIFASLPTPDIPPVTAQDWLRGPADAPVTMIEYADFQ